VNYYLDSFLALELARDRLREADQYRLAALVARARPARSALIRRRVARVLAAVSRLAAIVVRRLDQNVADDLARSHSMDGPQSRSWFSAKVERSG